ncbi:YLP motif-containing protein 1-like [Leptidea sinapis]|uniref:YLP motif-containing protein 1-like n=1 Tax=Leptidea sinapis TaxID=189913 RepID=UPI0021C4A33F|nr:YLP motif-containing protein 1-like [Leptidea sinapis]
MTRIKMIMWLNLIDATVDGISYLDDMKNRYLIGKPLPGEDPCNPLYWYPKNIPEYCYYKIPEKPKIPNNTPQPLPIPLPIPVPHLPQPPPIMPMPPPILPPPIVPPIPPIVPPILPIGPGMLPIPPPPLMVPINSPFLPIPHLPYGVHPPFIPPPLFGQNYVPAPQLGFVPGISGMVSHDGGINVLPFSDAYSDMLEKHKNKMIRKKIQRVLDSYENFPSRKYYRRLKQLKTRFS